MGENVLARGENELVAVEAKRRQRGNYVRHDAVEKVQSGMTKANADRAAVVTTSGFRDKAEHRAEELNVELVDGQQLVREWDS